jgi:beta-N-acetylhexosaminidase
LTCGKHFPGYAGAGLDPHHDLPVISRTRTDLESCELAIFRQFVDQVSAMMIGHAWYPAFDQERVPASLSVNVIKGLLKAELEYDGLVMTDDLDMGAVINSGGFDETILKAMNAGSDMVMICHRVNLAEQAYYLLTRLEPEITDRALSSVTKLKTRLAPPDPFSEARFEELDRQVRDLRVATLGQERAAQRSPDDGKRSPVEVY